MATKVKKDRLDWLEHVRLDKGAHAKANGQACVMEAVSYIAGEKWSDTPECASPVLGAFLRTWNDALDDDTRQQLKGYALRLVGTKGTTAQEDERAWMALDWLVRDYTPVWLRLAGLNDQADRLAGLPEFVAGMDVPAVRSAIDAVRKDAAAAGDAAWDAAGDAAWDAAWAAAGAAAWAAAWAAARAAARDAAWAAARAAARDAAWDAAWAAAGDAAGDAAWDAAWAAARAAARDALAPSVLACQESAHRLVERMIEVTS